MSYKANAQKLETASARFTELLERITHTVQTGRDSIESAAKVSVLAQQAALASTDFWEALSTVHCDNLSLSDTPCENSDDFAVWARDVAHSRSYAPFPNARVIPITVEGRPALQFLPIAAE